MNITWLYPGYRALTGNRIVLRVGGRVEKNHVFGVILNNECDKNGICDQ